MIKLSETTPAILAYADGVLECFFDEGGSQRMHVSHIQGIQLEASGQGKYLMTIKLKRSPVVLWVDQDRVAKVNELIAELQKAKASFKL
jgi:hypothetical protein